jgi:hypothetical protein
MVERKSRVQMKEKHTIEENDALKNVEKKECVPMKAAWAKEGEAKYVVRAYRPGPPLRGAQ